MATAPKTRVSYTQSKRKTKCDGCLADMGTGARLVAARMARWRRVGLDGAESFLCTAHCNDARERDGLERVKDDAAPNLA